MLQKLDFDSLLREIATQSKNLSEKSSAFTDPYQTFLDNYFKKKFVCFTLEIKK